MIVSFACKETQKIFNGELSAKFPADIQRRAYEKLWMVNSAERLDDLRIPLSNHLEKLKGDRRDQHSIRINGTYRVCFVWNANSAMGVEIVNYHKG
ncbi:MAG: type II toxin-antitoxin system RelE/ParE family toxin [Proteobacteria bacterium]|nr:type II toxin-antitoxin system RelE/ParE family toxin [Pseudomonadota bacterium]